MQEYVSLVRAMNHDAIAEMFVAEGEIAAEGAETVRGRERIRAYLKGFANYHVDDIRQTSDAVVVRGDSASQAGTYWQRVRTPEGETVEVEGRYTADWTRGADGVWRYSRVATVAK